MPVDDTASAGVGSALPSQVGVTSGYALTTDGTVASWAAVSGGSGVTTMAAVGSTPSANGASISSVTLTMQPADLTHPGVAIVGAQTLGSGIKSVGSTTGKVSIGPSSSVPYLWLADGESGVPTTDYAVTFFSTFGTRFNTRTGEDLHLCFANVPVVTVVKTTADLNVLFGKLIISATPGTIQMKDTLGATRTCTIDGTTGLWVIV